jgi:small-conductance mechanosensitive channel
MTAEQSQHLKIGDQVCFNGYDSDMGTVKANSIRYVTIKWRDGHDSFTGHGEMRRVSLMKK